MLLPLTLMNFVPMIFNGVLHAARRTASSKQAAAVCPRIKNDPVNCFSGHDFIAARVARAAF